MSLPRPEPNRPLEWVLRGLLGWEYAGQSLRDEAMPYFTEAAQEVLKAPGIGERRNMLGRIPASIRPMVEAEVMRLWRAGRASG